jgi:hypothetical protein
MDRQNPASSPQAKTTAGLRRPLSKSIDCCNGLCEEATIFGRFSRKSLRFTPDPGIKHIKPTVPIFSGFCHGFPVKRLIDVTSSRTIEGPLLRHSRRFDKRIREDFV